MKRLLVGLLLLISALAILGYQIVASFPLATLRPVIERDLGEALGLDVRIAGVPRVDLFPRLELEIQGVRVANLPGRPSPALLSIGRLGLDLRVLPLLRRRLVIESLVLRDAELRIEPDEEGAWSLRPDLDELHEAPSAQEGDPLRLEIRRLSVHDLDIYFDRYADEDVTTASVRELVVEARSPQHPLALALRGALEGNRFEIDAELGSLQELLEPSSPFPADIRASFADAIIRAQGTLGHPRTLDGMQLHFEAEIADLAAHGRALGLELPSLGSVEISGVLVGRDGTYGIETLAARSGAAGPVELEIGGSVRDLAEAQGVDLEVRLVVVDDVGLLQALTSLSFPDGLLRAELDVDDADGSLGVEGEVDLVRPGRFELGVAGVFDDLRRFRELDARLDLRAPTLETLSRVLPRPLPFELSDLGPLEASARLVIGDGRLGLDQIDARLGDASSIWLRASGSVGDLRAMEGVELEAQAGAASTRELAAFFDRDIPPIGSLAAAVSIRDQDGSIGIERATLEVGQSDDFDLRVSGVFDDLLDFEEIAVEVAWKVEDLAVIAALAQIEIPAVGPLAFEGAVRGSAESLHADGRLELGQTVLDGDFSASLPPVGRPALRVGVHSPRVHLPDLLGALRSQGPPAQGRWDSALARWWRSDERQPIERLRAVDAEVRLEAERVTGYELLELKDSRISARLEDGHLSFDSASDYEAGRLYSRLDLDASTDTPSIALELETFNVDLTRVMSQLQEHTEYAGLLDLSIDLAAEGDTPREASSTLRGHFGAMLRDGAIVNRYSRALSFDVLRVSIPSFLAEPDADAPVRCLLALAPVEGGVARMETLYLEGERITITGTGQVDLKEGELDLRLTPRVHDPGLVSVAATVEVSGPIADPVVSPVRRSMLTSVVGALVRNAVRPLSVLDRLIREPADDIEDPCGAVAHERLRQMGTDEVEPLTLEDVGADPG
jgi:uncharacterized protein involved in outer membrane biogenesis